MNIFTFYVYSPYTDVGHNYKSIRMKIFYILLFLAIISCGQTSNKSQDKLNKTAVKAQECNNERLFGDISVCLVEIDGMTECYSNPKVALHANEFRYEGNEILGIYFNEDTYSKIENLGDFSYDDYFKVYSVKKLKKINVGGSELDQMSDIMEGNYVEENWDNLKTEFENIHDYISVGQPILLESYSPNNRIRSFVFLMKMQTEDIDKILVMIMNMAEIKQRLIYYSYYKNYEGKESINHAKAMSDYFGFKFTDENK